MTLAPTMQAHGVEGRRAKLSNLCSTPGCVSLAQHAHHIWPRSYLRSQPQDWVRIEDGAVFSNLAPLCVRHHNAVTGGIGGHKARIEYVAGTFTWHDLTDPSKDGPLFPQPEQASEFPTRPVHLRTQHHALPEGETCPTCGYTKPSARPAGPRRKSRTWTVAVPDDAEQGTEIMDDWIHDFAAVLGLEKASPRLLRYHVLAVVLAWASQRLPDLIEDVKESAGTRV